MENLDFENLADVPMIDEVQDDDTVLVVRDGEVFRADGSNLGGGGYVVKPDAADMYILNDSSTIIIIAIDTAVPGIKEAVESGQAVSAILDVNELLFDGELGEPFLAQFNMVSIGDYLPVLEGADLGSISSQMVGTAFIGIINGDPITVYVMFTDGHYEELYGGSTSVATLSLDSDEGKTETPYAKMMAALKKVREKWEARKNGSVENTD